MQRPSAGDILLPRLDPFQFGFLHGGLGALRRGSPRSPSLGAGAASSAGAVRVPHLSRQVATWIGPGLRLGSGLGLGLGLGLGPGLGLEGR
eukprot:scaffold105545_cov45-Phaeocystis_antarctica.AAC.3